MSTDVDRPSMDTAPTLQAAPAGQMTPNTARISSVLSEIDDLFDVAKADIQALMAKPDAADLLALKLSNSTRQFNQELAKRQNLTRLLDGSAMIEFENELSGLRFNNRLLVEAMAKLKGDTEKEAKKKDDDYTALTKEHVQLKNDYRELLARHEKLDADFKTLQQSQFTAAEVLKLRTLINAVV